MPIENTQFDSCPVCHSALTGTESFCPKCAFEIHRYPSDFIAQEDKKRQKLAEEIYTRSLQYEELVKEVQQLKDKVKQLESNASIAPEVAPTRTIQRVGYLVMQDDAGSQPYDIFPVNQGLNIYGSGPAPSEGAFCHTISNIDPDLQNTHFSIDTTDQDGIKARRLNGSWGIDSHRSNPPDTFLTNGTLIFIGSFVLTFIEHHE